MKKTISILFTYLCLAVLAACQPASEPQAKQDAQKVQQQAISIDAKGNDDFERAYFASGCFWCVEAVYESVRGVQESISGYSGGHTENPTYDSSNTGTTGHAEAVEIIYDASVVSFSDLVDVYFGSQNVKQVNGQGPDRGSQYRSIIFYQNTEQKNTIEAKILELEKLVGKGEVAAEVMSFQKFWIGEDYHQDYEKLHPNNGYIVNVSKPRLRRFQAKFPHLLKEGAKH
jgi:peptide-methionine (S)-S-oxide reductase